MAGHLPDEIWTKIIETGLQNPNTQTRLSYKDLCCVSMCCRRLRRLSNDVSLWSYLLSLDFPSRLSEPAFKNNNMNPKLLYQSWYEKVKEKRKAAERRAVMRLESQVVEHLRKIDDFRRRRVDETENVRRVVAELNDLRKVRQASVALNVWQPEIIRGRQKHIVEQCAVPVDSRINALEMELKLCKQQMMDFEKAYRAEKQRLEEAKELLTFMKYRPIQDFSAIQRTVVDRKTKRKKLKRSSEDLEGSTAV